MKKHQIQAIAKIRKLLTDNLHTGGAMVETIKANLDDTMLYEMENLMDDGRQMVQQIRIYLTPKARKYSTTTNRHISAFKEFIDTTIEARAFFEYAMF